MEDDDRTILPPGRVPAPAPPPDPDATRLQMPAAPRPAAPPRPSAPDGEYLPAGYPLQEFEVLARVGQGGFSIVYKAWDASLQREVALKEYMPSNMARRQPDCSVTIQADRHRATFATGLRSFIEEAKTLAGFDHPALVRVYRYFEANGTAYMVMQLALGQTLEQVAEGLPGPPDEPWLMALLDPLTAALQVVHAKGIAHRDIAPDNIMILEGSQRPLLLDFGAARRVIGENTKNPTAMLKPSYAPIEQYPETGIQQGAYTDVYALAAVVHRLLTGRAPPSSQSRSIRDAYEPLSRKLAGRYDARLLKAVDHGLALRPDQRTQTVEAFRREAGMDERAGPRPASASAGRAGAAPAPVAVWAAGGAALLLVAAGLVWWISKPAPLAPVAAPTAPAVTAAPAPAAPEATPGTAPAAPLPVETAAAMDRVLAGASPGIDVALVLRQADLQVDKTPLEMQLRSSVAGYFHVLVHDTDGAVRILFPSAVDQDNRIAAGQTIDLPRQIFDPASKMEVSEQVQFGLPTGAARLLAIVTLSPVDYGPVTRRVDGVDPVLVSGDDAARAQQAQPQRPYLLGRLACPAAQACPDGYGAAEQRFRVVP